MNVRHPGASLGYIVRGNLVYLDIDGELCEVLLPSTGPIEIVVHSIKPFVLVVSGTSDCMYIQRYLSENDNCSIYVQGRYLHSGYVDGNCILLSQKSDLELSIHILDSKKNIHMFATKLITEMSIDKMIPIRRTGKVYECITTGDDKYRVTFTETADELKTEPVI